MGLLGTVTPEEYTEALKPPPPPPPFPKGTEVTVEVTGISEQKISGKEGNHPYHWVRLKLINEEGSHRFADTVFSFSPKAKSMNIKFLKGFGFDAEAINSMPEGEEGLKQLVNCAGKGVCGAPDTYEKDGETRQKTTLGYMKTR